MLGVIARCGSCVVSAGHRRAMTSSEYLCDQIRHSNSPIEKIKLITGAVFTDDAITGFETAFGQSRGSYLVEFLDERQVWYNPIRRALRDFLEAEVQCYVRCPYRPCGDLRSVENALFCADLKEEQRFIAEAIGSTAAGSIRLYKAVKRVTPMAAALLQCIEVGPMKPVQPFGMQRVEGLMRDGWESGVEVQVLRRLEDADHRWDKRFKEEIEGVSTVFLNQYVTRAKEREDVCTLLGRLRTLGVFDSFYKK